MKNLLDCKGREFNCKIDGMPTKGKIQVERKKVYLCQDFHTGKECKNKLGFMYSWTVDSGNKDDREYEGVTNFKLLPEKKKIIKIVSKKKIIKINKKIK